MTTNSSDILFLSAPQDGNSLDQLVKYTYFRSLRFRNREKSSDENQTASIISLHHPEGKSFLFGDGNQVLFRTQHVLSETLLVELKEIREKLKSSSTQILVAIGTRLNAEPESDHHLLTIVRVEEVFVNVDSSLDMTSIQLVLSWFSGNSGSHDGPTNDLHMEIVDREFYDSIFSRDLL